MEERFMRSDVEFQAHLALHNQLHHVSRIFTVMINMNCSATTWDGYGVSRGKGLHAIPME